VWCYASVRSRRGLGTQTSSRCARGHAARRVVTLAARVVPTRGLRRGAGGGAAFVRESWLWSARLRREQVLRSPRPDPSRPLQCPPSTLSKWDDVEARP
jgi:hypothetical protein